MLTAQWGTDGSLSPDGTSIALDRVDRWDSEWRAYRGGQNTPLVVLNLKDHSETLIPNESTTDIQPLWIGETVYFLSDRDWTSNVWAFTPGTGALKQITTFKGADIKWLGGNSNQLVFEREGYLHLLNPANGATTQLNIEVKGDFPWAETKWEDVSKVARSASLSPSGKRAIMEARGEVFTVPIENGDARNITQSADAADRAPMWSPTGNEIAWFSDNGKQGYRLYISSQDGLAQPRTISMGESKMAWEPAWSPDGKYIAFTDDKVRIRIVDVKAGTIQTADVGGTNVERGSLGLIWSPDSKWLAYAKSGSNDFRRIYLWSQADKTTKPITDAFADAFSPSWDLDKKHLYFLASTDLALGSGWANTSAMTSDPEYAAYVVNLRKEDPSPFVPKSDEEIAKDEKKADADSAKTDDSKKGKKTKSTDAKATADKDTTKLETVQIDFEGIERRTMALPLPVRNYPQLINGPGGRGVCSGTKSKSQRSDPAKIHVEGSRNQGIRQRREPDLGFGRWQKNAGPPGGYLEGAGYRKTLGRRWENVEG